MLINGPKIVEIVSILVLIKTAKMVKFETILALNESPKIVEITKLECYFRAWKLFEWQNFGVKLELQKCGNRKI